MISANGGLPAHRYTPQVTPRWPRGSEPASLSHQSLYRVLSLLALLQDSFTETRDEQCVCCIRDEHTCGLYLIH